MTTNPLVSVIIPTKNSSRTLDACLKSIENQTYESTELIVIDNNSTDNTKEIAKKYTDKVFNEGPERSAQRNFGAAQASGEYVLFIDSDMELSKKIVFECVEKIRSDSRAVAIAIPEESFGEGFWAKCKKLERSFYVGVDWMEAARFFKKEIFSKSGGYNEAMISGEDWDLSQRVKKGGRIIRISNFIYHNEGKISLAKTIKKKFYYAKNFHLYKDANKSEVFAAEQISTPARYMLFFAHPIKLFKNPPIGLGMLFMKTCEFVVGGVGYLISKNRAA